MPHQSITTENDRYAFESKSQGFPAKRRSFKKLSEIHCKNRSLLYKENLGFFRNRTEHKSKLSVTKKEHILAD